jgi:hypothetical protein
MEIGQLRNPKCDAKIERRIPSSLRRNGPFFNPMGSEFQAGDHNRWGSTMLASPGGDNPAKTALQRLKK